MEGRGGGGLQAGGRSTARHPGESAEDSPSDKDSGARDTCGIGIESAVAHMLATFILSFLTARRTSGRPLPGAGGLGNKEAPLTETMGQWGRARP